MIPTRVTVRVPATTANLGPGFDSLALALDLWNEATFSIQGDSIKVEVIGEGHDHLPTDEHNLVVHAALDFIKRHNKPAPAGLKVICTNCIPVSSGLGSSASANLLGIMGANALLGQPASREEIFHLVGKLEGHPDNAAAALWGGLVVVVDCDGKPILRQFDPAPLSVVVVIPQHYFPTAAARAALPAEVPMASAVYNLGRTALVVEALRTGDLDLLEQVMDDRLHQPYRLKLIPGAEAAMQAARRAGARAVALSGAGPSLVAFTSSRTEEVARAMESEFKQVNLTSRSLFLSTTNQPASVTIA
jgi:homoserine kinase